MALGYLLSHWAQRNGRTIYGVTVDHGLRDGSAAEAKQVKRWTENWPSYTHQILTWQDDKPDTRIMEEARKARYQLMSAYFQTVPVRFVFVAHHLDDQAETFLIRLAKGSGLDGLSAMRKVQLYEQDGAYSLTFLRPLLCVEKQDLVDTCEEFDVPYVRDPSNEKAEYLRPRLRAAREVLEAEGLSNKRLAATARRLDSARCALEEIAEKIYAQAAADKQGRVHIDMNIVKEWPEEIGFRVFVKAIKQFRDPQAYAPRLEKLETLYGKISAGHDKMKETLGGCIICHDPAAALVTVEAEHSS